MYIYIIYIYIYIVCICIYSFTNIRDSRDSRGRGAISLTPLYHFHPLHRH